MDKNKNLPDSIDFLYALNVTGQEREELLALLKEIKMTSKRMEALKVLWTDQTLSYINNDIRSYAGREFHWGDDGKELIKDSNRLSEKFEREVSNWLQTIRYEYIDVYDRLHPDVDSKTRDDFIKSLWNFSEEGIKSLPEIEEILKNYSRPEICSFYKKKLSYKMKKNYGTVYGKNCDISTSIMDYFNLMKIVHIKDTPNSSYHGRVELTRLGLLLTRYYFGANENSDIERTKRIQTYFDNMKSRVSYVKHTQDRVKDLQGLYNSDKGKKEFVRGSFISEKDFMDFYVYGDRFARTMQLREFVAAKTGFDEESLPTMLDCSDDNIRIYIWADNGQSPSHRNPPSERNPEGSMRWGDIEITESFRGDNYHDRVPYAHYQTRIYHDTSEKILRDIKIISAVLEFCENNKIVKIASAE